MNVKLVIDDSEEYMEPKSIFLVEEEFFTQEVWDKVNGSYARWKDEELHGDEDLLRLLRSLEQRHPAKFPIGNNVTVTELIIVGDVV